MYAIVLANVEELDSKADHSAEIVKHLEKAVELDADDAYTVHMLGVAHYKKKNYAEALSCFQKAENIRSHFSTRNLYYMGMAHHSSGHKEEAIKCFIASYKTHAHNEHELKEYMSFLVFTKYGVLSRGPMCSSSQARALAKTMLLKLKVKREDYVEEEY